MGSLLPNSSGLFEKTLEASYAQRWDTFGGAVAAIRTAKHISPPPSFLPYLIYEYGLGELTPYVPNLYTLIVAREGVNWQRLRGTPAAIARGLGWIGYTAAIEEAWAGRTYWNSLQLRFGALPANDDPDLGRIEGITSLSLPQRSQLRRGVYQYDAGAIEADGSRLDHAMLEHESGIAVTAAGTLWSFGRTTEIDHVLTEEEGMAIGNWIAPPAGDTLRWSEMRFPWATATFPWAASAASQRRALMAAWFQDRVHYVTFRDADGGVIGHRRCRTARPVVQQFGGAYRFGDVSYQPIAGGTRVYIEALTDFDDVSGRSARSIELSVGGSPVPGVPNGRLWLNPGELIGTQAVAPTTIDLPLRATVREQIKILMRF